MICYGDRTFCGSPNCKNECGRKLTDMIRADAKKRRLPISMGYFCGTPVDDVGHSTVRAKVEYEESNH